MPDFLRLQWLVRSACSSAATPSTAAKLSIARRAIADVIDGVLVRQAKAYPMYDQNYRTNVARVREFLGHAAIRMRIVPCWTSKNAMIEGGIVPNRVTMVFNLCRLGREGWLSHLAS